MKKPLLVLLMLGLAASAVSAQEDKKAELVQMLRSVSNDNFDAELVARFVTIEASPAWWERLLNPAGSHEGPMHSMANVGGTVAQIAKNLGFGDAVTLDRNSSYDGKSPLLLSMLDGWKGKVSFHIVLGFTPDDKSAQTSMDNLERTLEPFGNTDDCKPRGGKFFGNLKVDPKVAKYTVKVSKDGNTYDVVLPALADLSQPYFRESLHPGK